jgi:hypothetical protein
MSLPRAIVAMGASAFLVALPLCADQKKLTDDQRVEILRGLSSEYAKVAAPLPRSKKPLDYPSDGKFDKQQWADAAKQFGPAGRIGDTVQVTKVTIEKDAIILEINGGMRAKGTWKDHLSVGVGGGMSPINGGQNSNAPSGTTVAVRFGEPIGSLTSADVKKILAPVLEFERQTVTEQYVDTIPAEFKKAIEEKKPVEGMDRDQVRLALGPPTHKSRETKDGVDYEDWIYGIPPGKIMFVTFSGATVVKVKETYAGLGGSISDTPKQP